MRCGDQFGLELNWNAALTLYYDSVEELGWLACFKCLLFRFEEDHFRIEYVAFTLTCLTRGNTKSDTESLKRFRIVLKRKMTIEKTTRH